VKLGHAKFQRSKTNARGTLSNWELNERGYEIQWKTGHISETVRDRVKVTINH